MGNPEIWRDVVKVLSRHWPATFWRTSDPAVPEFWWCINGKDDVRDDRVLGVADPDDALHFHTIHSAVVFREDPGNPREPYSAERWERLTRELSGVRGLTLVAARDVRVPGGTPRNEALELTVTSDPRPGEPEGARGH